MKGKIILKNKLEMFMAPNGNGGLYDAVAGKTMEEFEALGVKYLHILGVDNVLNKFADPTLIGYAQHDKHDIVSKYVARISPKE
jgi:UDP-N-acetylglucosamine/UDP-N-acetylgalactosamine diphosphorylase